MNTLELSKASRTVTVVVPAPKAEVFSFLSQIESLPVWATEFCNGLKSEGEHLRVLTSFGELFFRIEADVRTGVIVMFSGPSLDEMDVFPCGVVALRDGKTAISFTFFRSADLPARSTNASTSRCSSKWTG